MIIIAYQLQGWWTIILSTVKDQPYGINFKGILLNISWHTHQKNSNPYTFILQKLRNYPDVFYTHLLFASAIIQILSGVFLHRLSRIIKFNIKWVRLTTTYF